MTSVEEHRDRILAMIEPVAPVATPVTDAVGLVVVGDHTAPTSLPRCDHAAMDGYAVRAVDVAGAGAEGSVLLPVAGVIAAGDDWTDALAPGTALRIMTGAAVPDGADAVVPFEWTDRGDPVAIDRPAPPGGNIRRAGEDVVAGDVVAADGDVLAARHLGLLAAVGLATIAVRPRPRVALIATGAELVGPGAALAGLPAAQVLDSNSAALAAAARAVGADVTTFGPVPDDPARFTTQLEEAAASADIVVTTGGVSAGDHDVVKAALRDREGFWFGSVAVKPGKPQGAGVLTTPEGRHVPVVSLPGTPVAAYTSFLLYVAPALRALAGRPVRGHERAVLSAPVPVSDRTLVLPAVYDADGRVRQVPGHIGHSQRVLAQAEALLVVPPGATPLPAGAEIDTIRLDGDLRAGAL